MTERPPDPDVDPDAESSHHALVGLLALSGVYGELDPTTLPGFRPQSPATSLREVAEAPEEEVSFSARLAALHDLARAGFPELEGNEAGYQALAASIADRHDLDADQLLTDLKVSAGEKIPFRRTATGMQLPLHVAAFVGEDVCTTRKVDVGGLTATWIFSEFETDASFDHVAEWVDPRNWPQRGPMLFKRMEVVGGGSPIDIASLGDSHWHSVFHEEVRLITRVNTLLHCDYWRDGQTAAGMTYELDFSLDGELDVDRGFLSVNDLGAMRRVKALKIVGFTNDVWDRVAQIVCPFWTDWVRAAVEGGTTTTPTTPSHSPSGASAPWMSAAETLEAWVEFLGDSAQTYLALFGDVASRASSSGYSRSDWLDDGNRYWSQLAKDWARAWTYGVELLDDVAREGVDAGFMPPGYPRTAGRGAATAMTSVSASPSESVLIPVAGIDGAGHPKCSDLVSIEDPSSTISSSEIMVSVEPLGVVGNGVRLSTTNTSAPQGLYVGSLMGADGQVLAPVQLYISRAIKTQSP